MSLGSRIYATLQGDRAIWMIVAILAIFSILIVYSATGTISYKVRAGNTEFYLLKQCMIVGVGMALTYMFYMTHYMQYSKAAPFLVMLSIPLLVYTIAFGEEINEARRWIELPGLNITFQTSEFAKIALILFVARAISAKQEYIKDFKSAFLPIIVPILIVVGLIAPADLSSSLILFFTCVMMMFMGRVDMKYVTLLIFLGVVVFAFLIILGQFVPDIVRLDTWVSRMKMFMENDDGIFQVTQAKIAIANGEFIGLGPGNSIQRNFIPESYSDFIYSIIIEEYGLLGGGLILCLYVLLFFRCVGMVTNSTKSFGAMLALGIGFSLCLQALVNMAVNVNLVPVTGLTLPMLSMGGTSVLFTSIAFGMILSVSRYIEKVK